MKAFVQFLKLVILFVFVSFFASAQIPNPGFEQWSAGSPDGWYANNFPGFFTTIVQSGNSHSGNFAAQGQVDMLVSDTIPPFLTTFFPNTERYATLSGYYRFSPIGDDELIIEAVMYIGSQINTVGVGYTVITDPATSYTQFNMDIQYNSSQAPDSCFIYIGLDNSMTIMPHPGSTFHVDDLSFSGVSAIPEISDPNLPSDYLLKQNYPNPFNPSTTIEFSVPASQEVSLTVYNTAGQKVENLIQSERLSAGNYKVEWKGNSYPNGIYFYRLTTGNFTQTKKMILVK